MLESSLVGLSNLEVIELQSKTGTRYVPYPEFHQWMMKRVEDRIHDRVSDAIVICEHEPVITRGRGLQDKTKPLKMMPLKHVPEGTHYQEVERGGDLTWHGPGQLMIYPIVKLGDPHGFYPQQDLGGYLRALEKLIIDLLSRHGIRGFTIEGATGVWVEHRNQTLKIASIGIALKKWVSYHGIGLNVGTDLRQFAIFSPCGFDPEVMTNMMSLLNNPSRD
jgi:lipoate-protein ligase B